MRTAFFLKHPLSLIILSVFFVTACENKSKADLVDFVDSTYKNEKPEIEPLPPVVPYEEFIYTSGDLADPFNITNVRVGSSQKELDEDGIESQRRKEPLEAYSLDALRMDGIVEFSGKLSAIINTPDGVVPVSVGDYIGLNEGKILSINTEEHIIVIQERFRNALGLWETREVEMVSSGTTE